MFRRTVWLRWLGCCACVPFVPVVPVVPVIPVYLLHLSACTSWPAGHLTQSEVCRPRLPCVDTSRCAMHDIRRCACEIRPCKTRPCRRRKLQGKSRCHGSRLRIVRLRIQCSVCASLVKYLRVVGGFVMCVVGPASKDTRHNRVATRPGRNIYLCIRNHAHYALPLLSIYLHNPLRYLHRSVPPNLCLPCIIPTTPRPPVSYTQPYPPLPPIVSNEPQC